MPPETGEGAVDLAAATITTAQHQAALAAAREEGRKAGVASVDLAASRVEGATAERARIAGIQSAALPGHEALIAECIADGNCSPGDAALKINAAERGKLAQAHADIRGVEKATGGVQSAPVTRQAGGNAPVPQTNEGWEAEYAADTKIQGTFPTVGAYQAHKRDERRKAGL